MNQNKDTQELKIRKAHNEATKETHKIFRRYPYGCNHAEINSSKLAH